MRLFNTPGGSGRSRRIGAGCAGAAVLAAGMAVAHAAPASQQQRSVPSQNLVIKGDTFEGDWLRLDGAFIGNASLTSPQMTLHASRISAKGERGGGRIASASATGNVRLRTQAREGAVVTATGAAVTYQPGQDRATLTGGVKLHFTSPRLAEPAVLAGDRVELAISTGKAVVHRTAASPVSVAMRPKAGTGLVELTSDRVEADTRGGLVTAVGNPVLKHPQGTLAAEKIWFELDGATSDVSVARAEGGVRMRAAWGDGRTAEGRSQRAAFLRAQNKIVLEGDVSLEEREPGREEPSQLSGGTITYDLTTRRVLVQGSPDKQVQFSTVVPPRATKDK